MQKVVKAENIKNWEVWGVVWFFFVTSRKMTAFSWPCLICITNFILHKYAHKHDGNVFVLLMGNILKAEGFILGIIIIF